MGKYKDWKEYFKEKNKYSDNNPLRFYDLVANYLPIPENKNAVIVDVGCGRSCEFETYLSLWDKYKHLFLLEMNKDTIDKIRLEHKDCNVIRYTAPNKIPLENESVDFLYSSHMIEHLYFMDMFKLIKEFDRILKPDGILIIRSPMLWFGFYETLDHIKPYLPLVFIQYLCDSYTDSPSYQQISKDYKIKELVYRYTKFSSNDSKIGSSIKLIDFIIQSINQISRKVLKIKRYKRTAYTLIMKKMK